MKRMMLVTALLLIAVTTFAEWNYEPEIISGGDEFTEAQFITARLPLHDVRHYRVDAVVSEKNGTRRTFLVADLRMYDWVFIERLYMLIDGEQVQFEATETERETLNKGRVREVAYFVVSGLGFYQRLAEASSVRLSFRGDSGRHDVELDEGDKDTLSRLLSRVED